MIITIVDYDAGNIKSIGNMLEYLGIKYKISSKKEDILSSDGVIFPGQGHFRQAMENLETKGLTDTIKQYIETKRPFLGICLGLQILFERSEEACDINGLGIIKGKVKKFKSGKIPQIGWNKIVIEKGNNSYLTDDYFYFVNSYYVDPDNKSIISSRAFYHQEFCASIEKNNITAVQFHPEKSAQAGVKFFQKWVDKII